MIVDWDILFELKITERYYEWKYNKILKYNIIHFFIYTLLIYMYKNFENTLKISNNIFCNQSVTICMVWRISVDENIELNIVMTTTKEPYWDSKCL